MARLIGKVDNKYFEYCTLIAEPVTYLMSRKDFKAYYRERNGSEQMPKLMGRLERADRLGTSIMGGTFAGMIEDNVYCGGLAEEEFKEQLRQDTAEAEQRPD